MNLSNYIKISSEQFPLLNTGDYITWVSDKTMDYTPGAMIDSILETKNKRRAWIMRFSNNKSYTIYWDLHSSVMVRKPFWTNIMERELVKIWIILGQLTNSMPNKDIILDAQKNISERVRKEPFVYEFDAKKPKSITRSTSAKLPKTNK